MRSFYWTAFMKRVATFAVILVQLWVLSPVCCCWLKAATADGEEARSAGGCCCQSDEGSGAPAQQPCVPPERARDCRCQEMKVQLPTGREALPRQRIEQTRSLDEFLASELQISPLSVVELPETWFVPDLPPPLTGADRLYELHRLNL